MRRIKELFLVLGMVCWPMISSAEEPYWDKLQILFQDDEAPAKQDAALKYLQTLTPEQLVIAAQQCCRWIESNAKMDNWYLEELLPGGLMEEYPRDDRGIARLLDEIDNKDRGLCWRRFLVGFVCDAASTTNQRFLVVDRLIATLHNAAVPLYVRKRIPHKVCALLRQIHSSRDKSEQHVQGVDPLAAAVQKSMLTVLDLLSSSNAPPPELQNYFMSIIDMCCVRGLPGAKKTLETALRDHKRYNQQLWPALLSYGERTQIENVATVRAEMERDSAKSDSKSGTGIGEPAGQTNSVKR